MSQSKDHSVLHNIRIASPCKADWDKMSGDERVRFCQMCKLNVYNLSEMTADEAEELVTKSEGRVCVQLYRRKDGTILTKDCPVGLRLIRQKVAGAVAAVVGLMTAAAAYCFGGVPQTIKPCQSGITRGQMVKGEVAIPETGGLAPPPKAFMGKIASPEMGDVVVPAPQRGRSSQALNTITIDNELTPDPQ